jgi:hypothetical protein
MADCMDCALATGSIEDYICGLDLLLIIFIGLLLYNQRVKAS